MNQTAKTHQQSTSEKARSLETEELKSLHHKSPPYTDSERNPFDNKNVSSFQKNDKFELKILENKTVDLPKDQPMEGEGKSHQSDYFDK